VTLRDRSFGDTSNAATVAVTKRDVSLLMENMKNIFQISSGTPRVDTTVAVSDISPYGLSRNVKYSAESMATSCKKGLHVFWALNAENGFLKFKSKD
jgi:hypothetical protein